MNTTRRVLTRRQVEYFALGGTLGAGIFLGVGQGIHIGGPALILAYAISGMVMYFVARCLGEIALNGAGGGTFVSYTRRYLGPRAALVQGWGYWSCGVLVCMAELTAAGLIVHSWFPLIPQWVPAFVGLLLLGAVNCLSVRVFGKVEFGMAVIKIVALTLFLLFGLIILLVPHVLKFPGARLANLWAYRGFFPTGVLGFLSALPVALFAFGGSELVCLAAAETMDPERALPRAINGLLVRLLLFYVGTTLMIVCLLPWNTVPTDTSPILAILDRLGFPAAGALMAGVLVSVLLSSCNSLIFGISRVLKSLAEEHSAPAGFGDLNQVGAPGKSVGATMAAISLAIGLNYFVPRQIFGLLINSAALTIVGIWATFLLVHLRFRRNREVTRALRFSVPLSPVSNYLVLAFLAGVTAILAFDPSFRPVFAYVLSLFVTLLVSAFLCHRTAIATPKSIRIYPTEGPR